jgi:hypothetical protein
MLYVVLFMISRRCLCSISWDGFCGCKLNFFSFVIDLLHTCVMFPFRLYLFDALGYVSFSSINLVKVKPYGIVFP